MKDLLTQASEIAELHDMDHLLPMFNELTAWRPEHQYECTHCQQQLGALTVELLAKYELDPIWTYRVLLKLRPRGD